MFEVLFQSVLICKAHQASTAALECEVMMNSSFRTLKILLRNQKLRIVLRRQFPVKGSDTYGKLALLDRVTTIANCIIVVHSSDLQNVILEIVIFSISKENGTTSVIYIYYNIVKQPVIYLIKHHFNESFSMKTMPCSISIS